MDIAEERSTIKHLYRKLFEAAHTQILDRFDATKNMYQCPTCQTPPQTVDVVLHEGCGYKDWQKATILMLERDLGKDVLDRVEAIKAQKEVLGHCGQCAACCRLASSEFDWDTLQQKAAQGDDFAEQFTRVFLPYPSVEAAQERFPVLVAQILASTEAGSVHFYHCPYVGDDNRCTIYTDPKRPDLCDQYPATPLTWMYPQCEYQPWRKALLPETLETQATLEIAQFYADKILAALKATPQRAL